MRDGWGRCEKNKDMEDGDGDGEGMLLFSVYGTMQFSFCLEKYCAMLVRDDLDVFVLWPGFMLDFDAVSSFGSALCFFEA
jgi:hypothetical protein